MKPKQSQRRHGASQQARLEHLMKLACEQGYVSARDIANTYPVADMSADDLARVMARLEEAGVRVELDLFANEQAEARELENSPDVIRLAEVAPRPARISEGNTAEGHAAKAFKPDMVDDTVEWLPSVAVAMVVILTVILILAFM